MSRNQSPSNTPPSRLQSEAPWALAILAVGVLTFCITFWWA
ncbi:hypothetical protein [Rhodococcus opacus]|nr:hypothetical protein [Rhodococcus opacus]UZG57432.1 hypothetical protein ONE62_09105 [Rhodococcus opacus]